MGPQCTIRCPQSGRASSVCCFRKQVTAPGSVSQPGLCKSMDRQTDICSVSLIFGRLLLPSQSRLHFGCLHLLYLCVEGQSCCRNGKPAGVPGQKLLMPFAKIFAVSRPDNAPLFIKARQNLTVNRLRKRTP